MAGPQWVIGWLAQCPHGHWQTSTFIAGLRQDGLVAPCVFQGAINGDVVPRLCRAGAGSHTESRATSSSWTILARTRSPEFAEAIEAAGAILHASAAYSPDLNPIEQAFAKLKAMLRAKALRTVDALWNAPGSLVGCFTPAECANYLRHAGYFQST